MRQLDDHLKRKLLELIYFLRGCDVRHLTTNPGEGVIWVDGCTIRLEGLRSPEEQQVRAHPGACPEEQRAFVVLYHHRDPAAEPSFIARQVYRPTFGEAQRAVEETFKHDQTVVAARVYELNHGELRKVADASRAPSWRLY